MENYSDTSGVQKSKGWCEKRCDQSCGNVHRQSEQSRWKPMESRSLSPDTENMIGAYEAADETVSLSGAYEKIALKMGKYHHIIDQQLENHPSV